MFHDVMAGFEPMVSLRVGCTENTKEECVATINFGELAEKSSLVRALCGSFPRRWFGTIVLS